MNSGVAYGILLSVLLIAGVLFWLFSSPKGAGRFSFLILGAIAVLGVSFSLYSVR